MSPSPRRRTRTRVPFLLRANLIIVKASINDAPGKEFVLDTGATLSVLTRATAGALKLPDAMEAAALGAGGTTKASLVAVSRLAVGAAAVGNLTCAAMDLRNITNAAGGNIAGVLGTNFLSRFKVTIDYRNRTLTLEEALREPPPEVPFRIEGDVFRSSLFGVSIARPDATWDIETNTPLPQVPAILQKKGGRATAMLAVQPLPGLSLKEALPTLEVTSTERLRKFRKLSAGFAVIGGREAYVACTAGRMKTLEVRCKHVFWKNGDDLVNLNCTAPAVEFSACAADFDRIIASVDFEK